MKYASIIFLLLLACSVQAQKTIVSRETSYRIGYSPSERDTVFFQGVMETFSDGSQEYRETILRDTSAIVERLTNAAINQMKRFTQTAAGVWEYPAVVAGALQANTLLNSFGTSVTRETVLRYGNQVDSTSWDITTAQGTAVGFVVIHPNGNQFRLTVGGTNYNMLPIGDAMFRINNYPSQGTNTDFFRLLGAGYMEYRTINYAENAQGSVTAGIRIRIRKQ